MNSIGRDIFKAIHEGKWLSIEYRNKHGSLTKYWIVIYDIDVRYKRMRVEGLHLGNFQNTTKLSKTLEGVNKNIKNTQTEFKDVQKLLKLDPSTRNCSRNRKSTREGCLILLLVFVRKLDDLVYCLLAAIFSLDCHIQGSGVISCNIICLSRDNSGIICYTCDSSF